MTSSKQLQYASEPGLWSCTADHHCTGCILELTPLMHPGAATGYGPQKLCTLAAYAMRMALLHWLEQYKMDRQQEVAALRRKARSTCQMMYRCRGSVQLYLAASLKGASCMHILAADPLSIANGCASAEPASGTYKASCAKTVTAWQQMYSLSTSSEPESAQCMAMMWTGLRGVAARCAEGHL